jgi:hypothetical protein
MEMRCSWSLMIPESRRIRRHADDLIALSAYPVRACRVLIP